MIVALSRAAVRKSYVSRWLSSLLLSTPTPIFRQAYWNSSKPIQPGHYRFNLRPVTIGRFTFRWKRLISQESPRPPRFPPWVSSRRHLMIRPVFRLVVFSSWSFGPAPKTVLSNYSWLRNFTLRLIASLLVPVTEPQLKDVSVQLSDVWNYLWLCRSYRSKLVFMPVKPIRSSFNHLSLSVIIFSSGLPENRHSE